MKLKDFLQNVTYKRVMIIDKGEVKYEGNTKDILSYLTKIEDKILHKDVKELTNINSELCQIKLSSPEDPINKKVCSKFKCKGCFFRDAYGCETCPMCDCRSCKHLFHCIVNKTNFLVEHIKNNYVLEADKNES